MKYVGASQLSNELDLDEDFLYTYLLDIVNEESKKDESRHFFIDEAERGVYIVDAYDLSYIIDGPTLEISFRDLAQKFAIESNKLSWLLDLLFKEGIIDEATYNYYTEIKEKPDYCVYFEPETIFVGEEVSLVIDLGTRHEISQPRITVILPDDLDMIFEPKLPEKILLGRRVDKYRLSGIRYGSYDIKSKFEGLIDGRPFEQELKVPQLIIKSLPPELQIIKIPMTVKVPADYNRDLDLKFSIVNNSQGEAQRVSIIGLNSEFVQVLSGVEVGRIAVRGRVEHLVRLRPRKSGEYLFNGLNLSYEDGDGNKYSSNIPDFTLEVSTPQPDLKIDINSPRQVNPQERFQLTLQVTNRGLGAARNIGFSIPVEPPSTLLSGSIECSIPDLPSRMSNIIELQLQAPSEGLFKIDEFTISFTDEEGNDLTVISQAFPIIIREVDGPIPPDGDWPFEEGEQIKKYQILKFIDEGGLSKVYRVKDTVMELEKALKALKDPYLKDVILVEDFIEEAKRMIDIRSPNIVIVYDADKFDYNGQDYPYIVMEYLSGGTLEDKINPENPIYFDTACMVILDMWQALMSAHQLNIVHCDIKPSNIFYDTETGDWKLGDFGMAKVMRSSSTTPIGGTWDYMAPESHGETPTVDERSDIYSLGLVFKEMLTGELHPSNFRIQQIKESYEDTDRPNLDSLLELIDKMTNRDPAQRPSLFEVRKNVKMSSLVKRTR